MIQDHCLDDLTRRRLRRLEPLAHDVTAPFSCGGTVPLAAPPTLRFPTGHRLPLDLDLGAYRVVEALKRRARKASFGEGSSTRHDPRVRDGLQLSASGGPSRWRASTPRRWASWRRRGRRCARGIPVRCAPSSTR